MSQLFRPSTFPPLSECIHYQTDETRTLLAEVSAGQVTHETNAEFLRLVQQMGLDRGEEGE